MQIAVRRTIMYQHAQPMSILNRIDLTDIKNPRHEEALLGVEASNARC